jgi:hypothetical protein
MRTRLTSATMPKPVRTPISAVMIGNPIATTDPKATSMMMIAAVMPIPSLGPGEGEITALIGGPPSATSKLGAANDCAVVITRRTSPAGSLAVTASNWIAAKPITPFGAPTNGDTAVTDRRGRMAASASST